MSSPKKEREREREDVGKTQHKPKEEEEDDDDDFEDLATFFLCVSHSFFPTRKALFFLYLKTQEFFVIIVGKRKALYYIPYGNVVVARVL